MMTTFENHHSKVQDNVMEGKKKITRHILCEGFCSKQLPRSVLINERKGIMYLLMAGHSGH